MRYCGIRTPPYAPLFEGNRCDLTDRLRTSMGIPLPRDKAEIMSSWKDHEIRRKSYLNIACVIGAWKKWAQERTERTRETRKGRARKRVPKRPLASRVFLPPKYFQATATQATSTKLTLWVVCLGHSNLGRYPLVGPVGIPRTQSCCFWKSFWMVPRPGLYSLYSTGICRWTGYGFWPLCPKQGI